MRLLVLDGSRVLVELVRRLAPPGVEVECADSIEQAFKILMLYPPDALIVNVSPSRIGWNRLQGLCHEHSPPIPVLYESCVYHSPREAGIDDLDPWSAFLAKPYHAEDLKHQIHRLVTTVIRLNSPEPQTQH